MFTLLLTAFEIAGERVELQSRGRSTTLSVGVPAGLKNTCCTPFSDFKKCLYESFLTDVTKSHWQKFSPQSCEMCIQHWCCFTLHFFIIGWFLLLWLTNFARH